MTMRTNTLLVAAIPQSRGNPTHYEHLDDTAFTNIDTRNGKVTEVHTPQDALRRIHEAMHARHTKPGDMIDNVPDVVAQIVEDCRLHLRHWPWSRGKSPASIAGEVAAFCEQSIARIETQITEKKTTLHGWPMFAETLRAYSVMSGVAGSSMHLSRLPTASRRFALSCIEKINQGCCEEAAREITAMFFPEHKPPELPKGEGKGKSKKEGERRGRGKRKGPVAPRVPPMDIIDLPKTERCAAEEAGHRIATSGARIYRPALRRPTLSPRMFVRQGYNEPAGTVLIDASGSMGELDYIYKKMREQPQATIAYYGAIYNRGELFIYAKDGWRAATIQKPIGCHNVVDGQALDWLMRQDAPRTFITDRQFCGAPDSQFQIQRLDMLEARGELTVENYKAETGA